MTNRKWLSKMNYFLDRVENNSGKAKNCSLKAFLLFPQCSRKSSSSGSLKIGIMRKGLFQNWNKQTEVLQQGRKKIWDKGKNTGSQMPFFS